MRAAESDWYKRIWSLDIKAQSWVEDTARQVDFICRTLQLKGHERILDLACGFGRHALAFARRGFFVTGVDITPAYVADAAEQAKREGLDARFILSDIRDVTFAGEFDVVLNMADGAIGYLENDAENLRIFDVASRALKPGGRHFMDIMNAGYADTHFPCQLWDAGENGLTLSRFEWDKQSRIMLYGQCDVAYGARLPRVAIEEGNPTRLYGEAEIDAILRARHMEVTDVFADFSGKPASDNEIQMLIASRKGQ
ncbi:MAG: class I SAM-dependent methyltransferase [Clostridia bacterium]|nr:class I SAM-dependent methyltransferase [Clostridia bacterium]